METKLLEALAARAEQKEKDRLAVKQFSVGGVEMRFRKPRQAEQLTYYGALAEAGGADALITICKQLIYDCCEDLQDPELHRALGVTDPYDVVSRLLDVPEIDRLGGELLTWAGLVGTAAEDTAKN